MFTGVSLLLFTLETFLPQPVPGGRIGLSQLITLLVLYWYGWREAGAVLLARVLLASLFAGGILGPVFILSLGGGITALAAMAVFRARLASLSPLGVSVIGATAHNLTQLGIARLLFIRQANVWALLPYFAWTALASGLGIGLLAYLLGYRIERAVLAE